MSFKLNCVVASCFFSVLLFSKSNNYSSQGKWNAVVKSTNTYTFQNNQLEKDSLNLVTAGLKKDNSSLNMKLASLQRELLSEKEKSSTAIRLFQFQKEQLYGLLLLLGILLIATVSCFYLVWNYRFKLKKITSELFYSNETVKITNSNFLVSEEKHQEALERLVATERELTALTMQLANIQDSILSIIEKAGYGSKEVKDVKTQNLIKEIRSILSQKEYWAEFMMKFSKIHPEFNTNIKQKYPKLTSKDISFCSLIKLNLSNKEIANLLQVSHESVITKKYLLKKKLELQPEEDLFQIVNNID